MISLHGYGILLQSAFIVQYGICCCCRLIDTAESRVMPAWGGISCYMLLLRHIELGWQIVFA